MKNIQFKEKAQSLVEMAFSFTIMMMLLAGAVDFGRAFFSYIAIYDGAQEGAVFGSHFAGDNLDILNHVRATSTDPINLLNIDDVDIEVDYHDTNPQTIYPCLGDGLTVKVIYAFEFTMPFVSLFLSDNSMPLSASATSTVLAPICF